MSDLVNRLRFATHLCTGFDGCPHCEAADEIERLRAEAATFHADYRQRCDVETKALHTENARLRQQVERLCDRGTLQALRDANDRAERAERERDELRARLDRADCTHREGGDTRHCRHDRLCWHCRHDEAVALLREVREWHRCPWKHGASVEVIDLQLHAAWIARIDAALKEPL